ncbi:hypothetical protein GGF46_000103 [Coemansia sp. RSA 552]|nr:hypothetical protein GGF46_000103 [Coemansia sp. RSA 552]
MHARRTDLSVDRTPSTYGRLPDIFEPDEYSSPAHQVTSLNVLFTGVLDVERMLEPDSPAARYNRRRVASCSAFSGSGSDRTACSSHHVMSDTDFSQSEEFLLLKDECYDYPTYQHAATISAGRTRHCQRRKSSISRLKNMVSGFFASNK